MSSSEGAADTFTFDLAFGPDASTTFQQFHLDERDNISTSDPGGIHGIQAADIFVPTANGSGAGTTLGNKFYWSGTKAAGTGTATVSHANFRAVGYVY